LAGAMNRMGELLEEKDGRLRDSLGDLEASRDDARAYGVRLEEQLRILNHIQSISEFLGSTFDREEALRIILRTCVEGLGLDRVALFLLDPDGDRLRCLTTHGFDPAGEAEARARVLSLAADDCVATRVVRTGRPLHVADGSTARELSLLGQEPARAGGATSFVCAPMTIRDAVVGALAADNAVTGRPIPEHRADALQIVAGQAARAVERARLFDEAVRSRAFVQAVVDSLATGLVTLDPAGRILTANPYAQASLGLDGARARGQTLAACGVDSAVAAWVEGLGQGAGLEPAEFDLDTPRGRRTFTWVPSRFAADGGEGLIVQFRDITEERALNRTLERVDRLASLGRLAAGVAHEIRNPLTGVSLLLDDLHDRLPSGGDRSLAARALQEIERLETIVQEFLDYARVDRMTRRPVRVADLLDQSLFLVKKQARTQGVEVGLDLGGEPLPPIEADPEKLKQALLNLYLNALQAMGAGGELRVSARADGPEVVVRVEDTGPGIPPEELDRIFEPFYTLRPGGTGLGLSIAHTIVADHGGRLEAASGPGQGAVFTVRLPAAGSGAPS
ncbi:MAG: ATP-binding protein, partial [Deferrisomatales bacterium]